MPEREKFNSKILLFGEYALMEGSRALSIPYDDLHGRFIFRKQTSLTGFDSNSHLKKYAGYLKKLCDEKKLPNLNVSQFEQDIENGLVFESNIPLGYGLGSSGALVAAVYEKYGQDKISVDNPLSNKELVTLKQTFATMESWFHGKSSGLDPLICYLQKAVLVESSDTLKTVELPRLEMPLGSVVFLLDTGATGETQPLVNYFVEQCEKPDFLQKVNTELIPLNEQCINAYLSGDEKTLFSCLEKLSVFSLQYFLPMIPENILPVWKNGLDSGQYFLKLCGSGGGGMMLGFTRNYEKTKKYLEPFSLKIVQQF